MVWTRGLLLTSTAQFSPCVETLSKESVNSIHIPNLLCAFWGHRADGAYPKYCWVKAGHTLNRSPICCRATKSQKLRFSLLLDCGRKKPTRTCRLHTESSKVGFKLGPSRSEEKVPITTPMHSPYQNKKNLCGKSTCKTAVYVDMSVIVSFNEPLLCLSLWMFPCGLQSSRFGDLKIFWHPWFLWKHHIKLRECDDYKAEEQRAGPLSEAGRQHHNIEWLQKCQRSVLGLCSCLFCCCCCWFLVKEKNVNKEVKEQVCLIVNISLLTCKISGWIFFNSFPYST